MLFVIDPRPYAGRADKARRRRSSPRPARSWRSPSPSASVRSSSWRSMRISQEEYDTRTAGSEQAQANVEAAQAALDAAALNLEFTRVTAPISGRISRAHVTQRQLRHQRADPADHAGVARPDLRELRRRRAGVPASTRNRADGARPARPGASTRCWSDSPTRAATRTRASWCSSTTSSIPRRARSAARALLDNHDRAFTPGLFARVRLLGERAARRGAHQRQRDRHRPDRAVRARRRRGQQGRVPARCSWDRSSTACVWCSAGLTAGETIVVNGLQRVRPGAPGAAAARRDGRAAPGRATRLWLMPRNGSKNDGEARP